MKTEEIPMVIMTCDKSDWALAGLLWTIRKRCTPLPKILVFGYREPSVPDELKVMCEFHSIGRFEDFPADKWSNSFTFALNHLIARGMDVFWFMLDDYWLTRDVDMRAVKHLYDYMEQFKNVVKIDLCTDRLYANGGASYLYGNETYGHAGYLDLIKSDHNSPYHMSLWSGLFRASILEYLIVPNEKAQEIEMAGTSRLSAYGDKLLVLGTRQAPVQHINVMQGGKPPSYSWGPLNMPSSDLDEIEKAGCEVKR